MQRIDLFLARLDQTCEIWMEISFNSFMINCIGFSVILVHACCHRTSAVIGRVQKLSLNSFELGTIRFII